MAAVAALQQPRQRLEAIAARPCATSETFPCSPVLVTHVRIAYHPIATPDGTSTMRIVESSDVESIHRPSADQARSVMVLRWPRSSRTTRPTSVLKTRMH